MPLSVHQLLSSLLVALGLLGGPLQVSAHAHDGAALTSVAGPVRETAALQVLPAGRVAELLQNVERIHPDVLASLSLDLASLNETGTRLLAARLDEEASEVRQRVAVGRQALLRVRVEGAVAEVLLAQDGRSEAIAAVRLSEDNLASVAVSTFIVVEDGDLDRAASAGQGSSFGEIARASKDRAESLLVADEARLAVAVDALAVARGVLAGLRGELAAQVEIERVSTVNRSHAQSVISKLEPEFEEWLLLQFAADTDMPVVVLDAYYRAALASEDEYPSCRVGWSQLAGIGKVESRHGSYGGNSVGLDGRTDGEILGPVLDGEPFAAISDTDLGVLDGDLVWDRAVGPMQFIPGSWSIYGRDGNGDGVEDPHNMYDAALAAAAHLCGSASALDERANFEHALLGYNQSVPYGQQVLGLTEGYAEAIGPILALDVEVASGTPAVLGFR